MWPGRRSIAIGSRCCPEAVSWWPNIAPSAEGRRAVGSKEEPGMQALLVTLAAALYAVTWLLAGPPGDPGAVPPAGPRVARGRARGAVGGLPASPPGTRPGR